MAGEADPPVGGDHPGPRLGDVVHQRAEAQRVTPGELIGQRKREQDAHLAGVLAAEKRLHVALELDDAVEHRKRVIQRIEVVVVALLHAAQPLELRQHDRAEPELQRQPHAFAGALARDHSPKLRVYALARDPREPGGGRAGRLARQRLGLQIQLAGQPHEPQGPQRVVLERAGRGEPQAALGEVARPGERVDQLAARQRPGDRVDREVAEQQVSLERLAAQRVEIRLPAARARHDAPGAEVIGKREGRRAGRAGECAGSRRDLAGDHQIEIRARRAAQQLVADRPPDDPALEPAQGLARELERARARAHRGSPSRWYSRGTRGLTAQVIS